MEEVKYIGNPETPMSQLIATHDFFALSSFLNYQLSGTPINWRAVLTLMGSENMPQEAEEHLISALTYLVEAYGQQKRRLGPFAVLHPIRTAALLARASEKPSILDLLTTLLHDKNEDIIERKYSRDDWEKLERMYQQIVEKIDSGQNWFLNERIHFLTRERDETYRCYLDRLTRQAIKTPELIRVKLADRLDNTLDLRMDLHEATSGTECYKLIFDALFADTYKGPDIKNHHHAKGKINGAMRLYTLFKNAVFLSYVRSRNFELDQTSKRLFSSLAATSINEAQNIILHIFKFHLRDSRKQKELLLNVMNYCREGCLRNSDKCGNYRLDGLFKNTFESENREQLANKLDVLYIDKELMAEASVVFVTVFTNFLIDRDFSIESLT